MIKEAQQQAHLATASEKQRGGEDEVQLCGPLMYTT